MMFKAGDRFSVKSNGITGQIIAIEWNRFSNEDEYVVLWDTLSRKGYYTIADGDSEWQLSLPNNNTTLVVTGQAMQCIPININITIDGAKSQNCGWGHEWIKYQGLSESFEYCKKCDKKNE